MIKSTNIRRSTAILYDLLAALSAWILAFELRFNFQIPENFYDSILHHGIWFIPLQMALFFYFGLYRGVWRFASLPDLMRIIKAAFAAIAILMAVKLLLNLFGVIPRSVYVLNPVLLIVMMGGGRFFYRAYKDYHLYKATENMGKPVLVVGSGDLAVRILDELARSREWSVLGLVTIDNALEGREVRGVEVLGSISTLDTIIHDTKAQYLLLALPNSALAAKKKVVEIASNQALSLLTLPSLDDLMSGKLAVSQLRKVEVEDLLGREPVNLDVSGLGNLITNKTVLVSGAGGSIGSELCRQIVKFQPSQLVCLDISEYALYLIQQELLGMNLVKKIDFLFVTADVKNANRMKMVLNQRQPTVVFHAAAYKHVPMMENTNVAEALNNNVVGTYTIANACKEANVEKFVLISTDKAVNPTNVMGASKRLAEMVCQGLQGSEGTRFVIVRFGNVLGSSGSVIPKFREQIAKGGPVTVTHPDITRYFMSIPEAAQLVMQAGMMGEGGEIFVLDMGDPIKIADLAKDMIRLSGLHHDEIKVIFTGLRPGEKLYEELLANDEHTLPTPHAKLRIASARSANAVWLKKLLKWIDSIQQADELVIKKELKLWVEEYSIDITNTQILGINPSIPTVH